MRGDNSTGYDDTTSRSREYNDASGYDDSSGYDNSSTEQPTPTTPETPPRENVHPLIEGSGAVNCNAGEACIDPKTGIAHVEYRVQAANSGVVSSNGIQTSDRGVEVAIPNVLKNVKVEIESYYPGKLAAERAGIERELINVGAELPIYVHKDSDLADGVYNTFDSDSKYDILNDQGFEDLDYSLHNAPVSFGTFEDNSADVFNPPVLSPSQMMLNGSDLDIFNPNDLEYTDKNGNKGYTYDTPNSELYNYLSIPSGYFSGLYTYTISGDVEVDSDVDEIYLPIRAEQKSWKCPQEGMTVGSYDEGCMNSKIYFWARNGSLPFYDVNDPGANADLARRNTADGLVGSPFCAVTRETNLANKIGEDVEPRNLNKVIEHQEVRRGTTEGTQLRYQELIDKGYKLAPLGYYQYKVLNDFDPVYSAGDRYSRHFSLHANPSVDYYVAGYGVDEDGCDQAAVKLTWCPDEEETPPPMPVTETIVTTTRETETVTETPPAVTTTLPPSTVVTTVTPDPVTVTETPNTETTTATSEVTTTVTSTPPTKTTTLPPVTETVVTTKTPEPQTSTITSTEKIPTTVTQTPEKETVTTSVTPPTVTAPPVTKTEITTSTEKVPTTVTETPERETVTTSVTPTTVTKNLPTTVVTQETITETKEIPTTVVSTEPGTTTTEATTVTETEDCDCTPATVTETPAPVTSTVVAETPTVTQPAPSTVVENGTAVVHLPEETVTVTPEPEAPKQTPVQRVLASTGASVLGLLGVGAGIATVGAFMIRRKN